MSEKDIDVVFMLSIFLFALTSTPWSLDELKSGILIKVSYPSSQCYSQITPPD